MAPQDISPGIIDRLYDLFRTRFPRWTEDLRVRVKLRKDRPDLSESAVRRRVVHLLIGDDSQRYRFAREQLSVQVSVPKGYSPLEQIKIRTGVLYPAGELTGGNYGARF